MTVGAGAGGTDATGAGRVGPAGTRATADLRRLALGCLLSSFRGDAAPSWVSRAVDDGLGGVCLYGSNRGADVAAVAAGLHDVRPEVVVALDEEGGDVTRLEAATGSSVPGNAALGAVDDVALTLDVAATLGAVLGGVGVDLDLAPCADVNSDPANPVIGVRSFGADAGLVARHTAAFVAGLQSAGVAACAKHFPGHGAVAVDSHLALPTIAAPGDVVRKRELAPFRAAVDAGVAAVMPGHLLVPALDPDLPASVSRPIVTGVLRGELGFTGLVVTDALDMGGVGGPSAIPANVVRALAAGADLCCLGPDNDEDLVTACVDAVVAAVAAGTFPTERVADAAARVASLRSLLAPSPPVAAAPRADRAAGLPASVLASGDVAGRPPAPQERAPKLSPDSTPEGVSTPSPLAAALGAIGAEAARRALRVDGTLPAPMGGAHVVELDRPANIAAGRVPWGVAVPLAALDPTTTTTRVAEGDDTAVAGALAAAAGRPLVVVVRDPQRRPGQATAVRTLLTARPDAVVVDMGWPPPAPGSPNAPAQPAPAGASSPSGAGARADAAPAVPNGAARITTFGASRASGEAVARLLGGDLAPDADNADEPAEAGRPDAITTEGRTSRG